MQNANSKHYPEAMFVICVKRYYDTTGNTSRNGDASLRTDIERSIKYLKSSSENGEYIDCLKKLKEEAFGEDLVEVNN